MLLEVLHDSSVVNTWSVSSVGTTTNVTYQSTDMGYQTQDGAYGGTSQTTFASAVNGTTAIHFRFYPTANNKTLFQYAAAGATISISSGNVITTSGITSPTVYVNNVQTTAVTLNAWNDVVITYSSLNATAFIIGVLSFTGKMGVVRLFSTAPSIQEIQSLYMEGLRKLWGAGLAPLSDGLVAYYDFNGDANDVIGGNNGTVTGATLTTDRFGNSNRAYSFNGSTNYMQSASNFSISGGTARTISCWVYGTLTNWVIASWGVASSTNAFSFYFWEWSNNRNLKVDIYWHKIVWNTQISQNTWTHIAVTYAGWALDTTNTKFYINWIADTATATGWWTPNTTASVLRLWQFFNWWNFFPWTIDWIDFYNRALSASEILALYQISSQRYLTPLLY